MNKLIEQKNQFKIRTLSSKLLDLWATSSKKQKLVAGMVLATVLVGAVLLSSAIQTAPVGPQTQEQGSSIDSPSPNDESSSLADGSSPKQSSGNPASTNGARGSSPGQSSASPSSPISPGGNSSAPIGETPALKISRSAIRPGDSIEVSGQGYLVGSRVSITIFSEPRLLGTFTVNSQGEFRATAKVPSDLEEGNHTVVAEGVRENGDTVKTSIGVSLDRTGPSIDSVKPTSGSFTVGDTLTITVVGTDASGIKEMGFVLYDITGGGFVQRDFCGQSLTLTSGSGAGTQTWSKNCIIPSGAISGDYKIVPWALDVVGNYTNVNSGDTDDTHGNMRIVGGVSDRTGPSIDSVTPTSGSFTVGDTLTITVVGTDASGIKEMGFVLYDITGGGFVQRDFCGQSLTLTSGSGAGTQTWSKACVVPDGVVSGDYKIEAFAVDIFDNYTNVNSGDTDDTHGGFRIE